MEGGLQYRTLKGAASVSSLNAAAFKLRSGIHNDIR